MNQKLILVFAALVTIAQSAIFVKESGDLVDVLLNDKQGRFATLVVAVQAADLVKTLQGEGPFTVLAPTNDAFAEIPPKDLEALLHDKPALTAVLLRHVISGKVLSSDLSDGLVVTTVGGPTVTVHLINDRVTFTNKAGTTGTVVEANIGATNGVVHALDKVI